MTETCPHDWTRTERPRSEIEEWACRECELTSATCCVDADGDRAHPTASSLPICERCLTRERYVLDDIEYYLELWDERDRGVTRTGVNLGIKITGGQAVESKDLVADSYGPEDVEERLLTWVAHWTEHAGATRDGAVDYLKAHLMWAAVNTEVSDFHAYRRDVRKIRGEARALVGLASERLADRCMFCNGQVVRDRVDVAGRPFPDGLQDRARCTRCGVIWEKPEDFQRNVRQHVHELPEKHADKWVTLDQAREIWPEVPAATWRTWVHRGQIIRGGRGAQYQLGDLAAIVGRRDQYTRGGASHAEDAAVG